MAQYDKSKERYVDRNNQLFDVNLSADENGQIWKKRYAKSAMQIPKTAEDFSLFHGMFSFGVLSRVWEEIEFTVGSRNDYVFIPEHLVGFNYSTSINQMLNLSSGTTVDMGSGIRTKRYVLCQPNRGTLVSASILCPDPEKNGVRNWGLSLPTDALRFQVEGDGSNWDIYAFRKTDQGIQTNEPLRQYLPDDFDITKSHNYHIQFDVIGNVYYFVDEILVFSEDNVNTLTSPLISDPALPFVFESITYEEGTELVLKCFSMDISIEGGMPDFRIQGSVSNLDGVTVQTVGTAALAVRVPRIVDYNANNVFYSRAITLNKVTNWCRDEAALRLYIIRDTLAPNLEALTWDTIPDSKIEYLEGGDNSLLDTAFQLDKNPSFLVANEWQDIEVKNEISSTDMRNVPHVNPGDIIIFEVVPISSNKETFVTFYYSEIR